MTNVYLTQCGSFTARHGHGGTLAEDSHEHHFTYEVTLYGPLNQEGYLVDFRLVQDFLARHINAQLNGADLNTLFSHPTTETLAVWIFEQLQQTFPQVCRVKLAEEPDRWIEFTGGTPCQK